MIIHDFQFIHVAHTQLLRVKYGFHAKMNPSCIVPIPDIFLNHFSATS